MRGPSVSSRSLLVRQLRRVLTTLRHVPGQFGDVTRPRSFYHARSKVRRLSSVYVILLTIKRTFGRVGRGARKGFLTVCPRVP